MLRLPEHHNNDLAELLLLRAAMAQFTHRISGGHPPAHVLVETTRYLTALRAIASEALPSDLPALLSALNGLARGRPDAPFRTKTAAVRAKGLTAKMHVIPTPAASVAAALDEIDDRIVHATALADEERLGFAYFEILTTHPFDDGNGRTARLYFTHAARRLFGTGYAIDITSAMRNNLPTYNRLLRAERSLETYRRWQSFFRGLLGTEVVLVQKLSLAVEKLNGDELSDLRASTHAGLGTVTASRDLSTVPMVSVDTLPRVRLLLTAAFS
jgi:Fic family protein